MHDEIAINPFQLLELPTDATTREIVERSQELMDLAETEKERDRYRWAKEQLISDPQVRLRHELFEMPTAHYRDEEVENFMRKYKRNPLRPEKLARETPPLSLQDFDLAALTRLLLEDLLTTPEPDISSAIRNLSQMQEQEVEAPLEVHNVIFG